eukprot:scaffold130062_cov63-Phaeocystis_antarctica.AAC.3
MHLAAHAALATLAALAALAAAHAREHAAPRAPRELAPRHAATNQPDEQQRLAVRRRVGQRTHLLRLSSQPSGRAVKPIVRSAEQLEGAAPTAAH